MQIRVSKITSDLAGVCYLFVADACMQLGTCVSICVCCVCIYACIRGRKGMEAVGGGGGGDGGGSSSSSSSRILVLV